MNSKLLHRQTEAIVNDIFCAAIVGVSRFSEQILMNAPLNSDSQLHTMPETGRSAPPASYSPSVPISVYRELATELKTTQSTLDALTQQNQQLLRQNKLLRTEIQRFVQSAEQLGHFAGVIPQESHPSFQEAITPDAPTETPMVASDLFQQPSTTAQPAAARAPEPPEPLRKAATHSVTPSAPRHDAPPQSRERGKTGNVNSAIVPHPKSKKRDRSRKAPDAHQYRLFTEQPDEGRPLSKVASRSDLGNLWLATTILLVVVSAFGAGFLIMRPLLNR